MLFQITRTSKDWSDENIDINNAFRMKLRHIDIMLCRSPEEFDIKYSKTAGKWFDVGENHRINKSGWIERDRDFEECWGIEINSLEELIKLQEDTASELIITTSYIDRKTPVIEIYDAYRE